jgi:septal ring factor EnvC (AmiA/AmiB activator)
MAGLSRQIAWFLLAAWLPSASLAFANDAKKQELDQLRARIEKLQRDVGKNEESRVEVADQLKTAEKSISEVNRQLSGLTREQSKLNGDLAGLAARKTTALSSVKQEQALLARMIRYQYIHGNADALRLMLNGEDVSLVERRLAYLGYVSKSRAATIESIKQKLADLASIEENTREKRDEIAENANAQKQARAALESERSARKQVLNRIKSDISKGRREIGRLKRDEDRLSKLIDQLARALAEQSVARDARRREKPEAGDGAARIRKPGEAVDSVADGSYVGRAFNTLRGKLKLPVRGELAGRFGAQREEGGVTWKGLFIRAGEGQSVRSVADGQVVYADWFRGYGNLLIVDHGSGYLSLYGNNESVLKAVGDSVKSGEVIASVGSTGGAQESGVYFELRQDGKPFDPMRWVGR